MSLLPVGTAARPRLRPRVLWSGSVDQATRLPETVIAFAGAKWVFLVQFSGAEVMVVSMVAVQGRAVVLLVSKSPRCRASCAKKFALHAQNTPKSAFLRLLGELFRGRATGGAALGEFFRGNAAGWAVLGEFFRGNAAGGAVRGEFFRANRPCA